MNIVLVVGTIVVYMVGMTHTPETFEISMTL